MHPEGHKIRDMQRTKLLTAKQEGEKAARSCTKVIQKAMHMLVCRERREKNTLEKSLQRWW